MKCIIKPAPPTTPLYDIHFTGLTELEAVTLRCLVSDSERYREMASKQARILQDFRTVMDKDYLLCGKIYSVIWEVV